MTQKIVMKVQMNCQKCQTKALTVAAEANGVNFVGLEGAEKDKVVVIGDGVDAAMLQSGFWVVGGGLCFSLVVVVAEPSGGWGLTCVSLF
ncbi:heavy metal-associated isoprenylated plant protein 47-like isoform X1 [Quercus lobata]|uniref:heavy metal-associated isoprenylated plant protein 47-like isoform X1 n=1 Tax=Quercus lobata TaxID=97700 RepID=UPI001247313A|nr:heavy metal-associated isoprenylated plant protein 47-like isoform X1 [Quercus lobata]